jgi:hypothetical protein
MQMKNHFKFTVALCFLAILLMHASVTNAASPGCGSWSVVQSPSPGTPPDELLSVATVSASNAWAVGTSDYQSGTGQVLIEHWNGKQWSAVSSPSTGMPQSELDAVAVVSANDIWAVGSQGSLSAGYTLIEHWNGTQWSIVSSPNASPQNNELSGVVAISAKDVWAVGTFENRTTNRLFDQTLIEHWNGKQWSIVSSPNPGATLNDLNGVTALSSKDVWAVGYYFTANVGQDVALTEHWNGKQWSVVNSPSPGPDVVLTSTAAVSGSDVWAVGENGDQTLTEHWNGTQWSVVASPGAGIASLLVGVAVVSTGDVWAVGRSLNNDYESNTLTEQWNGTQWSVVSSPSPGTFESLLNGVAASAANNVWAVGLTDNDTLIEHYC